MKKYRKPPVCERVISLGFELDEEPFQRQLSSWNDVVRKAFPQSSIENNWEISIAEKNGIPYLPPERQKFTTKHQFWKGKKKNRDCGIQVWKDRVAFNLLSSPANPRTFEDLLSLYDEWCPIWSEHFRVKTVRGVRIEYVNIISPATVPEFCTKERIQIGDILTVFVPAGPLKTLEPPYAFDMNFKDPRDDFPLLFHTSLKAERKVDVALRLDFRASTEEMTREIAIDEIQVEIDTAHELILDEFEAFFTEPAKASFEPI